MDARDRLADLGAHDPFERRLAREDRGHRHAKLGHGGRHLAADESHAHDHRAPTSSRLPLDRVALCDRPQLVDAGQLGPGDLKAPVAPARRYQQLLIADLLSGVERHRVRSAIHGDDVAFAEQLDVVLPIPGRRLDVPPIEVLL